jgi:hypothetical protein
MKNNSERKQNTLSNTEKTIQKWNTTRLKKQFQSQPYEMLGEENTMPSLTVPDQTLGIKELLINHSRGISSNVKNYEGEYYDTEIPIIDDLTDLEYYRQDIKRREIALKAKIKEEHDKKVLNRQQEIKEAENASNSETLTQ